MASPDSDKKLPRKNLPADARIETLAVREGLPPTQWGENSEALFLTSSFNHPDAATAAARWATTTWRPRWPKSWAATCLMCG